MGMSTRCTSPFPGQCLQSEGPRRSQGAAAPAPPWPQQGKITFQDVELRYHEDLPLVLKNLSFTVLPAETVGIVGRTGSGVTISSLIKLAVSTATLTLFLTLYFFSPRSSCRKVITRRSAVQTCGARWRLNYHWRDQYCTDWSGWPAEQGSHHSSGASALHWHCQVIRTIMCCINEFRL